MKNITAQATDGVVCQISLSGLDLLDLFDKINSLIEESEVAKQQVVDARKEMKQLGGFLCHGNQIPYLSHAHLKHCFRTILKPSAFHIGRGVALDAQAAVLVYI